MDCILYPIVEVEPWRMLVDAAHIGLARTQLVVPKTEGGAALFCAVLS